MKRFVLFSLSLQAIIQIVILNMYRSDKIEAIVYMRVLAMTMIVLFHSLLFYTGTWWNFGGIVIPMWVKLSNLLDSIDLSMFVYISGFLFGYLFLYKNKYRNRRLFLWGKFKRLIIPYLLWGAFMILFQSSFHNWSMLLTGISHLWFLLMLFNIFGFTLLVPLFRLDKMSFLYGLVFLIILYFLWLLYYSYSSHHFFLCIECTLSYSIPFFLGFFSAKYKVWNYPCTLAFIIAIIALIILSVYFCHFHAFDFILNDLFIRVVAYTFIICLFVALNKLQIPTSCMRILSNLDRLSMGIYIFNQIVINYVLLVPVMRKWLVEHYMIGPVVLFVISYFIPLVISYVLNRSRALSWMIGTTR